MNPMHVLVVPQGHVAAVQKKSVPLPLLQIFALKFTFEY
jgi:hypothetical protein